MSGRSLRINHLNASKTWFRARVHRCAPSCLIPKPCARRNIRHGTSANVPRLKALRDRSQKVQSKLLMEHIPAIALWQYACEVQPLTVQQMDHLIGCLDCQVFADNMVETITDI